MVLPLSWSHWTPVAPPSRHVPRQPLPTHDVLHNNFLVVYPPDDISTLASSTASQIIIPQARLELTRNCQIAMLTCNLAREYHVTETLLSMAHNMEIAEIMRDLKSLKVDTTRSHKFTLSVSRSSLLPNALLHISDEKPSSIFVQLQLLVQSQMVAFRMLKAWTSSCLSNVISLGPD